MHVADMLVVKLEYDRHISKSHCLYVNPFQVRIFSHNFTYSIKSTIFLLLHQDIKNVPSDRREMLIT
jgi:hypothetical protein